MASFTFVLFVACFLQGAFGVPAKTSFSVTTQSRASDDSTADKTNEVATTVSLGSELSNNLNENLLKVMDNMRTGVVQMYTPVFKFGLDTIPNLFTSGVKTMAESASKIADAKKKGFRKVVNGAGSVLGGGGVLGSSMLGGGMQVMGSGLGAANSLIEASAKFGLDITGNLADTAALSNMLFANITNSVLGGIGTGLNVAGDGVSVLSKGSAKVIDAIGNSVSRSIQSAQDTMAKWVKSGSAKVESGTVTLTNAAQVEYVKALEWYLHQMITMEGIMDKLTEAINSAGTKKSSSEKTKDKKEGSSDSS